MARVFRTLHIGRVGAAEAPCTCATCATSAPTTAAGAPASPDFAQAVRDSDKPPTVTPKAVDRTKAPAPPNMADYIKETK